jgi:hypothetical protein
VAAVRRFTRWMAKLSHAGRFAAALEQTVACGAFGQARFARPVVAPVGGIAIQAIGTRPTDVTVHARLAGDAAEQCTSFSHRRFTRQRSHSSVVVGTAPHIPTRSPESGASGVTPESVKPASV